MNMNLHLTSTGPMIMHNSQTADPLNKYAKAIKELTSKKTNKTEADDLEISHLKFLAGLYFDPKDGPYLPSANVFRCLIEAGSVTRAGKKVERGVVFLSEGARLEYDGPRDAEGLWGEGKSQFVDRRLAAVNRSRVVVTRPIFPEWSASFEILVDPEIVNPGEFGDLATRAGRMIGVGDYRRFYGRFRAEVN